MTVNRSAPTPPRAVFSGPRPGPQVAQILQCAEVVGILDAVMDLLGILIGMLVVTLSWPALIVVRSVLKRNARV